MAKLLAFWSGLSLSSAARIEVHEFPNQVIQPPPPFCQVGDHVACPGGQQWCSGNQCCADSSACPSADDDFTGCPQRKAVDCTQNQTLLRDKSRQPHIVYVLADDLGPFRVCLIREDMDSAVAKRMK